MDDDVLNECQEFVVQKKEKEKEKEKGERKEGDEEKIDVIDSVIHHNVKLIVDLQSIPEYENTLASILSTDGMLCEWDIWSFSHIPTIMFFSTISIIIIMYFYSNYYRNHSILFNE